MRNLDFYLDNAKARNGISSDRKLSEALGITSSNVSQFRTKRTWPADSTMVRLAYMAGADPEIALLELNIWRAHGAELPFYQRLLKAATAASAAVMLILSTPVLAGTNPETSVSNQYMTVYYGKFYIIQ